MTVKFSLYVDKTLDREKPIIHGINNDINNILSRNSYSNRLNDIYIGIICVSEKFKQFFPIREPSFNEKGKYLEYDIRLDFDLVTEMNEVEFEKYLIQSVMKSFSIVLETDSEFQVEELLSDLILLRS